MASAENSLRFYGTGSGDVDRVKVPIDPQVPADVSGDFTLEFWFAAHYEDIQGNVKAKATGDGWAKGNVLAAVFARKMRNHGLQQSQR